MSTLSILIQDVHYYVGGPQKQNTVAWQLSDL